jgi:transposase
MLTQEDEVEIHALAARGWSVSAIARHTDRDRKTVRKFLHGPRTERERAPSCLEPYRPYIAARFADDPHLLGSVLHQELVVAGFERAYTTMIGELRRLELRPVCKVCRHRRGRAVTIEIEHPPGEEIQWDWLELSETPWGQKAFVLVGALSHSGRFRGVFCEQMTFGHVAAAAHRVLVALDGTPRVWRTDRMATIVNPDTGRVTVDAAQLAKHYGVELAVCPPRRAQRKGVVERAIQYLTGSWWTSARVTGPADAQQGLDAWCARVADHRPRPDDACGGDRRTVAELAAGESLRALPAAAYPAMICVERQASKSALVGYEGNKYSIEPAHGGRTVTVLARVGEPTVRIMSAAGELIGEHRLAVASAGQTIRSSEHAQALETAVLAAFTTEKACSRKRNKPPSDAALAELAKLRGVPAASPAPASMHEYARLAEAC